MENDKRNIIDPSQNGIVYEDQAKFEESIFRNVYENAKKLTEKIVRDNKKLQRSVQYGNEFRNIRQMENVIAFIGRRGTGKTSAMLSFKEAMQDHNKNGVHLIEDKEEQIEFIGLESIDASILEKEENIFDAILANIFGEFQKLSRNNYGSGRRNQDYDTQKLYGQFEKIYLQRSNLEKRERFLEEGNALHALEELARSSEVRKYFSELIESYIKYKNEKDNKVGRNEKDCYLVVTIDDIDVNLKKGYMLLQEIRRYLMVPRLIVLIAVNYEQMLLCCEKRYVKEYHKFPKGIIEKKGERIMEMAEEYLEKILPPYMRVYQPSLKKMDYAIRETRKLIINNKETGIKEGLFGLIHEKTGVYYDAGGIKRHFIEPETLRDLSITFQLYNGMEILEQGEDEEKEQTYFQRYDDNYHKVMDEIVFRLSSDHLPDKEKRLFTKWSEEEILRRGEEIVDKVSMEFRQLESSWYIENVGSYKNAAIMQFEEDYNTYGYSYGELLRAFYCISRMDLYNKWLIYVLLYQYTVAFSRIFEYYVRKELPLIDEEISGSNLKTYENRDKIKMLMGASAGGSWVQYMLPQTKIIKDTETVSCWSARKYHWYGNITFCHILRHKNVLKNIINLGEKRNKAVNIHWDKCKNFLKDKQIQLFGVLLFFFSDFDDSLRWNHAYTFDIIEPNKGKDYYKFLFSKGGKQFNVFNFINNSFDYYNTIKKYYIALCEAFVRKGYIELKEEDVEVKVEAFMQDEWKANVNEQKIPDVEADNYSLLRDFKFWSKDGGLAVPVYNFDITYNLFKRILSECKREENNVIAEENTFTKLQELFYKIKEKLAKQDEFYNQTGENSSFARIFETCPVVKFVLNNNKELETAWNAYISGGVSDEQKDEGDGGRNEADNNELKETLLQDAGNE